MSALLASLDCSKSESEEDDTGEMHVAKLDMIPELQLPV